MDWDELKRKVKNKNKNKKRAATPANGIDHQGSGQSSWTTQPKRGILLLNRDALNTKYSG
jgi:hypothetical protein